MDLPFFFHRNIPPFPFAVRDGAPSVPLNHALYYARTFSVFRRVTMLLDLIKNVIIFASQFQFHGRCGFIV